MGSLSNYAESLVMNYFFGTTAPTRPAALAIALLTSAPDDTSDGQFSVNAGTEVTNAGGYARVALNPSDSNWTRSSGQTVNASTITFPTATADWSATVTHFAIVDSTTYDAGHVIGWGSLTASKTILNGDTAQFTAGQLVFTID